MAIRRINPFPLSPETRILIDLDTLCERGLADRDWIRTIHWGEAAAGGLRHDIHRALPRPAAGFSRAKERWSAMQALDRFAAENADWLDDYALFMSLKDENAVSPGRTAVCAAHARRSGARSARSA
jgi:4-alpha-glucanotransferase